MPNRRPCDVPSLPHSLNSRPYACGWRCDRHSPWGLRGWPGPTRRVDPDTRNEALND